MSVFYGWNDHVERIEKNWKAIVDEKDVVVIPGDISWAMSLEGAKKDFEFIHSLPGTKIILKGNHDYWWNTKRKMDLFLEENGFDSIKILHNNAFRFDNFTICGSRGWFYDAEADADMKVVRREAGRLRMSITEGKKLGGEIIMFLHYPPLSLVEQCDELLNVLSEEGIRRCYYGHLHGGSTSGAFIGEHCQTKFGLVSADYLGFCPKLIEKF